MNDLKTISRFLMLLQVVTQNVVSEEVSNSTTDSDESPDVNGRRSGGIIILDHPVKPDGHITSHKVETTSYTTRVTSGRGGSGVQGWVTGTRNGGNIVQQPQIQGIVQRQDACGLNNVQNNVLTNAGGQSSIVHKHSRVESKTFNADGSINPLTPNENQWQSGQIGVRAGSLVERHNGQALFNAPSQVVDGSVNSLTPNENQFQSGQIGVRAGSLVKQLNGQALFNAPSQIADGSINSLTANEHHWQSGQIGVRAGSLVKQLNGQVLRNGPSQVTNNLNDASGTIMTSNTGNQGINTLQQTENIQHYENVFHPDYNSYKVSLVSPGDGIYGNEPIGQQNQNLNVMVSSDSNSPNILAVPVDKPQLEHFVVQEYRPNIQHYLKEIESSNIFNNPSALRVPAFIEHIKPDQMNINLSEDQLNSYKKYLIQSGLIKLKPYQLIFSDQFRPKLKTLQWMVVALEPNAEFCRQRCGALFPRSALYRSLVEPLKLLVPVLKIQGGVIKTLSGIKTIADGVSDIPGAFQTRRSSSNVAAPNDSINQN